MVIRLPGVSTPISGIGELVDHMQNGVLAAEKDSESLAAAMKLLLEDPALRRRLGTNGRQRVTDAFSLDRSTGKVRDLLLRASDKAQPSPERVEAKASRGLTPPPRRSRV